MAPTLLTITCWISSSLASIVGSQVLTSLRNKLLSDGGAYLTAISPHNGEPKDYYVQCRTSKTLTHTGAGWTLHALTTLWTDFLFLWAARMRPSMATINAANSNPAIAKFATKWNFCTSNELTYENVTQMYSSETPLRTYCPILTQQQQHSFKIGPMSGGPLSCTASRNQPSYLFKASIPCKITFKWDQLAPNDQLRTGHIAQPVLGYELDPFFHHLPFRSAPFLVSLPTHLPTCKTPFWWCYATSWLCHN
jgi:hypothetical protein